MAALKDLGREVSRPGEEHLPKTRLIILLLGPQNGIGFSRLRDQQHGEYSDGKSDDDRWVLNVASPWDKSLGEDHLRDHSILTHIAGHRFEALTLKLSVPAFFADLACVVADVK